MGRIKRASSDWHWRTVICMAWGSLETLLLGAIITTWLPGLQMKDLTEQLQILLGDAYFL